MNIQCKDYNLDFGDSHSIICGKTFQIDANNIYMIELLNCFGEETKRYYYTICPTCGNLCIIDENLLLEEEKEKITKRMQVNSSLHLENLTEAWKKYHTFVEDPNNKPLIKARIQKPSGG